MKRASPIVGVALLALLLSACATRATSDEPPDSTVPATTDATPVTSTTTTTSTAPTTTEPPAPPSTTTTSTTTTTTTTSPPTFAATIGPVTAETVWATWREGCPVHFDELSLLSLTYWNLDGEAVTGSLAISTSVAEDVVSAFAGLFDIGFPIEQIALVDDYGGDDKAAMRANVTSGFNCRFVDGTDRWSNHAFGLAVDINPLLNPWAREGNVLPVEGTQYADRTVVLPGMINVGDAAITVFADVGWTWGGAWRTADYMHFSQPGN